MRRRCRCGQWYDLIQEWTLLNNSKGCSDCYQAERSIDVKADNNYGLFHVEHITNVPVEIQPKLRGKRDRTEKA